MGASDLNPPPAPRGESLANWAELVLLAVRGADFRRVGVEAVGNVVTLSGEVRTESERKEAAAVVRRISGVSEVKNQLRVAPEAWSVRRIRP